MTVVAMVPLVGFALQMAGCAPPGAEAIATYSTGNFEQAKAQILAVNPESRDQFLVRSEQGKISLDAGDPATARRILADASDWGERFAIYEPKTTIAEEAAAIAVNQTMRTYRGTYADRIMVDSYAVLSSLWLGDASMAAVFANRVSERQADAEVEQQKQIEKVNREIASYKGGSVSGLVEQVRQNQAFQSGDRSPGTAAFLNPFASWIAAMAWSATGDSGNLEKARTALRSASAMVPANSVLASQAADNPFQVAATRSQVIVLLEACRGTALRQLTIPLVTPWAGFSSIPLPLPEHYPCDVAGATISGGGATVATEALSDNDAIFMAQYDRMLPEIIFRTAVMIAAKEAATVAAVQAARNNSNAQIAILTGMSIYKAVTNQADIRSWRSIGKFTQIAQLDRPADGTISVAILGGSGVQGPPAVVPLPPGRVVMVYVRSMHAGATAVYAFPMAAASTSSIQFGDAGVDPSAGMESIRSIAVRTSP